MGVALRIGDSVVREAQDEYCMIGSRDTTTSGKCSLSTCIIKEAIASHGLFAVPFLSERS